MKNLNVMVKIIASKLAMGGIVRGVNISENGGVIKIGEISLNCHSGHNPVEVILKAFGDMSAIAPDTFDLSQKCDMDFELILRDVDVRKGAGSFKFDEVVITSVCQAFEILSQFEITKAKEEPAQDANKSEDVIAPAAADDKSLDESWHEGNEYI